jgi:Vacuolar protein sorting-associated protein 62
MASTMPSDAELLRTFCPVLRYDSHELYFADSAATLTDNVYDGGPLASYANVLRRKDKTVVETAAGALNLDFLGEKQYGNGEPVQAGDYLDAATTQYVADARRLHADAGNANHVYGVVRPGAGAKKWLQYWFFYYYNDKALAGFGVHEGDWEGIQIRVDADGKADAVTYAQHDGGEKAQWSDVELDDGAPVVYVGLGSHASYLRKGSHKAPLVDDVCDAGGREERPELEVLDDDFPSWVRWPGRWGASAKNGLISFPSPAAPRTQRRWRDPDGFHKDARPFTQKRGGDQAVAKPPPVVTASRSGDAITVQITGVDVTAKLVVSATIDGRPQALEYDLNELEEQPAQIHYSHRG